VSVYSENGGNLLATIDSIGIALDGDPAVNLNFAVTAGATPTLISVASSTVVFSAITGADAFATGTLTVTDNNGNGASAVGMYGSNKAYQATYNGGPMFAQLISPVFAANDGTATGTDRSPGSATTIIPGMTTSIQSQFSFVLSAFDSASTTSRFQVNIPPDGNVPEPSTLVLASTAAMGGFLLRRRRRSR
jgi:hypothetical protein